ncbi:MAG: restriction endonuclease subunit S [Ruminococcus sp.]|nr:restriction endonuclease subunit S [Ruminococcus sp.]
MDIEIKERIAAINSGIIPEGYKKTKVGIVPVEWKVEHIGEHLQEYRELSNDIEKHPVYSSSRKGLIPQSDYYDQKEATQTNLGYKIVPVGYVTYRHMSDDDIFHFNFNTTGQSVLVSSEYPVFNAKSNANLYYIISCLNEMPRFRYFCRSQKLGGTRTRLYYKNLSMYQLSFPPLPEQQKIAEILSTQDKLIELQEKKIEQLKELKKAYLQKMFPQKGSKYPELRFKGFTDPWEQRKLNTIADVRDGTHASPQYLSSGHPFITSKNVKDGYINYDDVQYISNEDFEEINKRSKVDVNDILMGMIGTIGNLALIRDIPDFAIKNVALIKDTGAIFYLYLYHCLQSETVINQLSDNMDGGTQKFVALKSIRGLNIAFPSRSEQEEIGSFFSNLDTLITLHQRKSEQEKQKKKALMQLLLTGIVRTK